jgi:hypothetical protein
MDRRNRLRIVLVVLVVLGLGAGLFLYLRYVNFLNQFACFDGGGSWIDGRCQRLP